MTLRFVKTGAAQDHVLDRLEAAFNIDFNVAKAVQLATMAIKTAIVSGASTQGQDSKLHFAMVAGIPLQIVTRGNALVTIFPVEAGDGYADLAGLRRLAARRIAK